MAALRASQRGRHTFIDLPLETQKNIIAHVSCCFALLAPCLSFLFKIHKLIARQVHHKDLICLLRVSRHFFALASSEIYRVLDFNSSCADDSGAPVSHLADALQTVVASDLDYGQHIRTFRLGLSEENSPNALMLSRVLWDSVADPSKALNTLILLTVRKATVLESFLYVLGHSRVRARMR